MSCPKTHHLLTEFFADDLLPVMREEIEKHLVSCADCRDELAQLNAIRQRLGAWREETVPHWDRGMSHYPAAPAVKKPALMGGWWQWLPTAASFAMLCVLLFNVSLTSGPDGFTIAVGSMVDIRPPAEADSLDRRLASFSESLQAQQAADLQAFMTSLEERQDSHDLRLMQAVLEQTNELNAASFERFYTYFEQQRQQDLQSLQIGYQQLADTNTETIQTVYQLADYVRFQGDIQ
ncbi:MAG: hypothetical protein RLZZ385_661 [Pseudomonadota bacterium]|jgi:anti-sigma factor RsiW